MSQNIETAKMPEKAALVGLITAGQTEAEAGEYLKELAFLTETAGGVPVKKFTQRLDMPNFATFVGSGKLAEIKAFIREEEIELVIFDDDLTPSQLRNIEKELACKILDRTNLILDIFARRAQTSYAKAQVELAQYQYLLPRLTRMWTHLERQQGGIGSRGPGESEIETDRRVIRTKIAALKEQLKKIDNQMSVQRKNRGNIVRVALVGYTNVGKSTLMNLLSKSEVFAEDKLFATLDTTVRKVVIDTLPFLLTDTVGFIRKLPHHLVESFKSTLDEVREADILAHVVDISHPRFEEQIDVVNRTLADLKVQDKSTILVFNKIDNYRYTPKDADDLTPATKANITLEELQQTWMATDNGKPCVFISALRKLHIEELKETLFREVRTIHSQRYPYEQHPTVYF
ncbi:MAG: GTPase HflX [Bacteroidales bacterium]|jgi:GTP-binding protein HflX|nr:GTPase HflX [Bacteroidales bacterium]